MTFETMRAVTAALVERGVPATFEYPGYICVTVSRALVINYAFIYHVNRGDLL